MISRACAAIMNAKPQQIEISDVGEERLTSNHRSTWPIPPEGPPPTDRARAARARFAASPSSIHGCIEHPWNDGRSERICPEDRSTTVIPDVMGYDRPDWPSEAEAKERTAPHMASTPHWGCEVLSPSTMLKEFGCKLNYNQRMGVRHYWLVDPDERTLEVFELDQESRRYGEPIAVIEENDPVFAAPFKPIERLPRLGGNSDSLEGRRAAYWCP